MSSLNEMPAVMAVGAIWLIFLWQAPEQTTAVTLEFFADIIGGILRGVEIFADKLGEPETTA